MEKKICALELASYLVRLDWTVYVDLGFMAEISIHLNSLDVPKVRTVLEPLRAVYHFDFEFFDRSDFRRDFYVCRCYFK